MENTSQKNSQTNQIKRSDLTVATNVADGGTFQRKP